ncbi:MAG: ribosomal protein [Dehalococcoidia bacterium]|nr:ribosomal protein [Dehalococcoidia bacterium]
MNIVAIHNLTDEQLHSELESSLRELMNLRFRWSTRQINNPRELGEVRKTIARLKTVMRQRGVRES